VEHFYHTIDGFPSQLPAFYRRVVADAQPHSHFVEVGCYKGSSSAAMCVEIINSNKDIKFDCIDIWSDETVYDEFLKNLNPVKEYFNSYRMHSVEAAEKYEDNSLDLVCIDASHDYEDVKNDILAWLPKVKVGGILAGDDFLHSGVYQAVKEIFPGYSERGWTWVYYKT
jgi:predicted O-methyltransferase YrrM